MAGLQIETNSPQTMRKSHCLANALSYLDKEYGIDSFDAGSIQDRAQEFQAYPSN